MKLLLKDIYIMIALFFIRLVDRKSWSNRMKEWGENIYEYEINNYQ